MPAHPVTENVIPKNAKTEHIMIKYIVFLWGLLHLTQAVANPLDKKIDLGPFTEIVLEGSQDTDITVGAKQSVVVHGIQKAIDATAFVIKNNVLTIKTVGAWLPGYGTNFRVVVAVPSLTAITILGSADVRARHIRSERFKITLSGSGDILLGGECGTLNMTSAGSGDVDAHKLVCSKANVMLNGSGDASLFVKSVIDADIIGSGDLVVFGEPKGARNVRINGSGTISYP